MKGVAIGGDARRRKFEDSDNMNGYFVVVPICPGGSRITILMQVLVQGWRLELGLFYDQWAFRFPSGIVDLDGSLRNQEYMRGWSNNSSDNDEYSDWADKVFFAGVLVERVTRRCVAMEGQWKSCGIVLEGSKKDCAC